MRADRALHVRGQLLRRGVDAGQHVLHIDHRDERAIDAGHRIDARAETQRSAGRGQRFAVAMHHVLQIGNQESLHRAAEFGDQQMRGRVVDQRRVTERGGQVDHRDGLPAVVAAAGDQRVRAGHAFQRRPAQHLAHLEHVEPEQLRVAQAEQQQRHPVVASQPGLAFHVVERRNGHAGSLVDEGESVFAYRPRVGLLEARIRGTSLARFLG